MKKLKLGAQLYTIRDYMKTPEDFTESMKKIADIGYKYVQVSGIGADITPECIKKATEENGLKVVLTHTNPKRIIEETDKVISEHSLFGCDGIGIGGIFGGYELTPESYLGFTKEITPVVEKIKKAGKVFLFHNHSHEFNKFDGKNLMDVLLENTDKDGLKLTLDCFWLHRAGFDVPAWITEHKDRIFCTHLKDIGVFDSEPEMVEVMTGNMNYIKILETCIDCGIEWHFVEQDIVKINAFESMKISFNNLMRTGLFE